MSIDDDFNVWEGVYTRFRDAPSEGSGFDGPIWRDRSIKFARETIRRADTGEPFDLSLRQRYEFLPVLTAAVLERQPRAAILDYGGGLGIGFVLLARAVAQSIGRIDYSIVEFNETCQAGAALFGGRKGPLFLSEPPENAAFDVVHAASVLQYIEDWRALIGRLAGYRAPVLVLTDIYVGDFATYVTSQNHHTSRIPHWFWNKDEFLREVRQYDYELAVQTHCELNVLGRHDTLPMKNFPRELRVPHGSNLLFFRRRAPASPPLNA